LKAKIVGLQAKPAIAFAKPMISFAI
jgi:hypothetical protein